ncbi:MAG: Maf family nucleotide pyrophosphatase [Boseongicola sp.]|nr:Maf family nucleotide pyrophosphatase [Boseongicola sp.]
MMTQLILASGSEIRARLLKNAGVEHDVVNARVDEETIKQSLKADGASPRDIADALAEAKARRVSQRHPDALVLGCDQVLSLKGELFSKPDSVERAEQQLKALRGETHQLLSAAVIYEDAKPIWRHVGVVRLTMRKFSDEFLAEYIDRNWESIRHSVGAYKLVEEGIRLFGKIEGDYFNVLGLPLLELLSYLTLRGTLKA